MRIRPGRTRSLFGGIAALMVMIVGLLMLSSTGGMGFVPTPFIILWVTIGLLGAGISFYNAFSREGVPLYEIEMDDEGGGFCPQCGRPVEGDDRFCEHCGAQLD
ncbi:MAG: zinc-ribbon domain-containing protein [Anaerolineales bacterium]